MSALRRILKLAVTGLTPASSSSLLGQRSSADAMRPLVARGAPGLQSTFATLACRPSIPTTSAACARPAGSHTCSTGCSCGCSGNLVARRWYADTCRLKPKFRGGKIKLRTAYKERFKAMKDGTIKLFPPGFRHRRFRKSNAQRLRLKQPQTMHHTYANTLKRMGFA